MGMVKDFAALVFVGTLLLVTLSACETSKHAEIMSTEDLRAQAQMPTTPDASPETESEQVVVPFEEKPMKSLGLSESLVFAPEPPPSVGEPKPAAPEPKSAPPAPEAEIHFAPEGFASPAPEPKPASPAPEPKPASPAPEPKFAPPAPEPKFAPPAPEPKFAPPAPDPVVEEPAVEPAEIAKVGPSDFVSEPPPLPPLPAPPAPPPSDFEDVFFEFDQYAIRPDAVPVLEKNAGLLKSAYKDSSVLVEGHCDQRGTREYNLELGKRRAQAVKDYLIDLGIKESRIQIVSYGKERPFCTEAKESCWKQNRRGHFVRQ